MSNQIEEGLFFSPFQGKESKLLHYLESKSHQSGVAMDAYLAYQAWHNSHAQTGPIKRANVMDTPQLGVALTYLCNHYREETADLMARPVAFEGVIYTMPQEGVNYAEIMNLGNSPEEVLLWFTTAAHRENSPACIVDKNYRPGRLTRLPALHSRGDLFDGVLMSFGEPVSLGACSTGKPKP
jgi:hypothetical protein